MQNRKNKNCFPLLAKTVKISKKIGSASHARTYFVPDMLKVINSLIFKGHIVKHNEISNHPVAVSLADLSVWCYTCESYIASALISKF